MRYVHTARLPGALMGLWGFVCLCVCVGGGGVCVCFSITIWLCHIVLSCVSQNML